MEELWNGFRMERFAFEDHEALIVFPEKKDPQGRWLYKTEYFGAFPNAEIEGLKRGWHLAYVKNDNRWGTDDVRDRQTRFVDYVAKTYGLSEKCVPVGMSCGGMQAVILAAEYPEKVKALYLDAPVMNFLSCPGRVGRPDQAREGMWDEFLGATGMTISELIGWRNQPMDRLGPLIEHKIPALMVYGDSDNTVPYHENGIHLEKAYREAGITLKVVGKKGCDHHPHGLEDPAEIMDYLEEVTK